MTSPKMRIRKIGDRWQVHCPRCGPGCWCETYDRATHGPLIDLPDQTCPACGLEHPGRVCDVPSLLDGGESC